MIEALKRFVKQLLCTHGRSEFKEWYTVEKHGKTVVHAIYECRRCDLAYTIKMHDRDAYEWIEMMGNYKKKL